jgi:hypothetical protein
MQYDSIKIDGKEFKFFGAYGNKKDAATAANGIRASGGKARVKRLGKSDKYSRAPGTYRVYSRY